MKSLTMAFTLIFTLLSLDPLAKGMSDPGEVPEIVLSGKLNCPYVSTSGGTAFLQISLSTPDRDRPDRRPMNLAVVLDRSGSMADAGKIEYAKQAILALIDQLSTGDIFSLVIYDDIIEVPFPAQCVRNTTALRRLVEGIFPRGATNLGGGMAEGFRQTERNLSREYVNRVILLSDGLANRGVTDPHELGRTVRRYRQRSVSLTTMGVGLEYNENLMVDLSQAGGGNYYFIESPNSLASIMGKELGTLSCVVVQNASIELTLGPGVKVRDVIGCEHREDRSTAIVPVGDLYARECREVTVELLIPEGNGVLKAVTGELRYDSERIRPDPSPVFTAWVHYTSDAAAVEKNKDWDTEARVDVALSTRQVDHAMHLLDQGQSVDASRALGEAQQALESAPTAAMSHGGAEAIRDQAARIRSYATMLEEKKNDLRRTKKSIQFYNYQTQKTR